MQHQLNNIQLGKILSSDKCTRKHFIGIFPRDKLPKRVEYPSCFVFNTDPQDRPGEHWIAVYLDKQGNCQFFDPLGYSPKFYDLEAYLSNISNKVTFNSKMIQPFYSQKCGYYSFLFLLFKCRGRRIKLSEKLIKKYFLF